MPTIDMESILAKAKEAVASPKIQKATERKVDDVIKNDGIPEQRFTVTGMQMAASKFIEILQNEVKSHAASVGGGGFSEGNLGSTAVEALLNLDHGEPYKVGKNSYQIEVWFTEDLSRASLAPDRYEGVENIAALLNTGYTAGHRVYGIWKGHGDERRASLVERDGSRFIENAIRDYMANYSGEYGVIGITVNDIYK